MHREGGNALRKRAAYLRYGICLLLAAAAVMLRFWAPETAEKYAEPVLAVIEGDSDFASAATTIHAWMRGEMRGAAAIQDAARYAFGMDVILSSRDEADEVLD